MGVKKNEKRLKKEAYWEKLWKMTEKYNRALFIDADNVSSKQINKLRFILRDYNAEMIMGKNTLMKAALNHKMKKPEETDDDFEERKDTWKECPELEKFVQLLKGNTGIIFTNGDLAEIKKIIDSEGREAPARIGAIAPDDVWIRAGSTGLDPKQTAFFQNLQIQTKIVKTQIEIVADKKIITAGIKIESSHAALLDKLKIRPFQYKMGIKHVYQDETVFRPEVLDISPEDIIEKMRTSLNNLASISLATGYITKPAVPHIIANAFKNLASVTFEADYSFPLADKMKEAATSAPVAGAPVAAASAAPAKEEEKPEEEEVDADMGGLFGDDEY